MSETLGQRLNTRGWQCGSIVPASLYPDIEAFTSSQHRGPLRPQEADWLLVLSQTCDLLAGTLDQEPHVELLWCRAIPAPRAQFRDLRSTRRLDFRPHREAHPEVVLSAHAAHDHYVAPRAVLERDTPRADRRLSEVSIRRLQAWLALRYSRPAWPDAFVARIVPVQEAIITALESVGRYDLAEVRIALAPSDEELPRSESYRLVIYFVVDEDVWNTDPAGRERIHAAFGAFVSVVGACAGIDVDHESKVVSGAQFTWQQMQVTEPWNFANLTWRD